MTSQDINAFIDKIRKNKKKTVRVRGNSANPTRSLSFRNSKTIHAPYMEVEHGRQTDVYEFEKSFKKSNLSDLIGKWILFSIQAKRHSGTFYLVVDDTSKEQYKKIIDDKKLDIELITIK